ncbi:MULTISPECIES: bifunctional UDP-N-acetylglucosamine diphosphorylase/glucosamine-1-phosphate N-acetyltransferase GlmU [Pseudonocardia]|uniref:Bifunctional protein GlmU n=2 Tax=Pseudonocardia TaxID=1847 RepID=A0A1Y2MR61_PSEAH|nr:MULTISPECIES: bifunctional UDP-N-acetylglucosamine diphosphorylase/glucosamine-1-phosphate N-acetyltransferase GlmU [Pseudonocardia]OSY37714.1 Bifunctional protein GlmU [Pseudonocardia autotrophica]TDN75796.1 UDP-N-acetylglucosamine pyrophosphorylase /glucosamine-1-phosphate N-acetyltransferase [Pseudonocardia autotrophica]BBF99767.1 bifunctional protein GlmU [Pseudonocardia autotrophica]GEC27091.1 bifunctional protein GlmU [Pseudonocardia saturnea]
MPDAHQGGTGDRTDPTAPGAAAAVVLAAGAGSRMRSATPKVLHRLGGRSMLGHALHAVAAVPPEHLVVVVGHERERVTDAVTGIAVELGRTVTAAVQENRLGTGDAVRAGLTALPSDLAGTVLVTYGDVPLLDTATLTALVGEHERAGAAVTLLTCDPDDPTGYGRIVRDDSDPARPVTAIVEHADATAAQRAISEVNSGVYAFDAEFLRAGIGGLAAHNSQQELYLTDLVGAAVEAGRPVHAVRCADEWLLRGVNDRVQLAELRAELNRRVLRRWMVDGVTVVDPATTWVDVQVHLGTDVVLHPGTQLYDTCTVGDGAEIGPDSTLTACAVGPGATVVRTHGSDAEIGADASVGPFAYLRPGARLGPRGKIGTFVEVKNADIGAGSKVPHLTYVGDASIGEMSNIGASSVFVNYDGVRKQRTTIGSHVRTGSDTMFIAPVTVGDGAYTGAGTVLRSDVPPGALAVSGGTQRTIEGWVPRKRPGTPAAEAAERAGAHRATHQDDSDVRTGDTDNGDTGNRDLSRGGTAR